MHASQSVAQFQSFRCRQTGLYTVGLRDEEKTDGSRSELAKMWLVDE